MGQDTSRRKRSSQANVCVHAFLDTNAYLHYRQIKDIDLPKDLKARSVVIIVPGIVVEELDGLKDDHPRARVRDRARAALQMFMNCADSETTIRKGVSLKLELDKPTIEWDERGLSPNVNDDVLLASVLKYREKHPELRVVLICHDIGPLLKCRRLGIEALQLPDEYRIPNDEDEIERLKREIARLKNPLPRVSLCFTDTQSDHSTFVLQRRERMSESQIQETLSEVLRQIPQPRRGKGDRRSGDEASWIVGIRLFEGLISDDEHQRYEREYEQFGESYEKYLRQKAIYDDLMSRTLRLSLAVKNEGSAPADDVDIMLRFPPGLIVVTKSKLWREPQEPARPEPPRTIGALVEGLGLSRFDYSLPPEFFAVGADPEFRVQTKDGRRVFTIQLDRVKHNQSYELPELFVTFRDPKSVRSFSCEYEIMVANHPDKVSGELGVHVEYGEVNIDSRDGT